MTSTEPSLPRAGACTTVLLAQAAVGVPHAFTRLLERTYGRLVATARALLRTPLGRRAVEPEDVVHRVLCGPIQSRLRELRSSAHFYAASRAAMLHAALDLVRHHARCERQLAPRGSEAAATVSGNPDLEDVAAVQHALRTFAERSPGGAVLLEAIVFEGLTMAHASQRLGVPLRTLERRWRVVRAALARLLAQQGFAPRRDGRDRPLSVPRASPALRR